jgi:hypothetical protein
VRSTGLLGPEAQREELAASRNFERSMKGCRWTVKVFWFGSLPVRTLKVPSKLILLRLVMLAIGGRFLEIDVLDSFSGRRLVSHVGDADWVLLSLEVSVVVIAAAFQGWMREGWGLQGTVHVRL